MSIRIRFALRPKNRLTGYREWTPDVAETMIKELAGEQGYTCESLSGCLLCRLCPEGYIWFHWDKRVLRGESQTNIVGPGFHVAVIAFLEELAVQGKLKLKVDDKTGYYWRRDFLTMRRKYFYQWFMDLMKLVSGWENGPEYTFCWPSSYYIPEKQEGKLITHIRPFSFMEIRGVVNSGLSMAFARDFFIWNEIEKDAVYYRNCALVLLNQSCFFMPSSRCETDKKVNDRIIECLEKALAMDSSLPFPLKEYLEICRLAEHEPVDVSHAEPLSRELFVGCRRHLIYRKLGNMKFCMPGSFMFDENCRNGMDHYYDGVEYGGHDLYIYAVVLGTGGTSKFKKAWFEQGTPEEEFLFDVDKGKGKAVFYAPEEKDGEVLYNMSAQVLYKEQRTNINITCRKPGEMEWALDLVKKITISE